MTALRRRREWRVTPFAVALLCTAVAPAAAQNYPQKPIRFVVPFAAGGTTDIVSRLVGQKLAESIGQSVIIENRPGANGTVGSEIVAKAVPDGYTLLIGYLGTLAINPHLYAKLSYDPIRDFAPITLLASTTQAIVVHPSLPAKNIKELIALAKARPGQIAYAHAGIGAPSHLSGELFKMMAGVDLLHVPYKGGGALMSDLVGGHVAVSFGGLAAAMANVKSGKLRILAVASARRSPAMPDVPTVSESGLPGFEVPSWLGVLAPAATPRNIVNRLHTEIATVLQSQDVKDRLAAEGGEVIGSGPDQFGAYMRAELARWGKIVRDARIRAE